MVSRSATRMPKVVEPPKTNTLTELWSGGHGPWSFIRRKPAASTLRRIAFLIAGAVAVGALLYQGKTGGELVYEHEVGMAGASGSSQKEASILTAPDRSEQREALAGSALRSLPPVSGTR
jgi:hypothetical protein